MKRIGRIIIVLLLLSWVVAADARSVVWSLSPQYDELKPYSSDYYFCRLDEKWGLIDPRGRIVLPVEYDFIIPTAGNLGIFGVRSGARYRLSGIVKSSGEVLMLRREYYMTAYQTFSEHKLPVANAKGKKGYINEEGVEVVRCQFDVARPFREGFAATTSDRWVYYITDSFDLDRRGSVLQIDFRNGEITEGSSFRNGEAVIGYGDKYCVINRRGEVLRSFRYSDWRVNRTDYTILGPGDRNEEVSGESQYETDPTITVFGREGRYGYRSNGEVVVDAVLDRAGPFDLRGHAVAAINGRQGILTLIEGAYASELQASDGSSDVIRVERDHVIQACVCRLEVPEGATDLQIFADRGTGRYEEITDSLTRTGNTFSGLIHPEPFRNAEDCTLKLRVSSGGLPVHAAERRFALEYQRRLRIYGPVAATSKADVDTDLQPVTATLHNDSNRPKRVSVTLTVDCRLNVPVSRTEAVTIPANGHVSVSVAVKVLRNETASARVVASSGESRSNTVALRESY